MVWIWVKIIEILSAFKQAYNDAVDLTRPKSEVHDKRWNRQLEEQRDRQTKIAKEYRTKREEKRQGQEPQQKTDYVTESITDLLSHGNIIKSKKQDDGIIDDPENDGIVDVDD